METPPHTDNFSSDEGLDFPDQETPDPVYEEHHRKSYPKICALLTRKFGSSRDVEDRVQQAFENALRYKKSFANAENKVAYLLGIASNETKRDLKRQVGKEEIERVFEHKRTDDVGFQPYEGWQLEEIIVIAEKTLTRREMDYFRLVRLDRTYNLKQLAERWNYSHGYMRKYASKADSKLREALQRELQTQG
jgi:DNA-directed RNA polymerase specialized sigma24 family protein